MEKYTRKQLKNLVTEGVAKDITYATEQDRVNINKAEGYLSQIGYSNSTYGCSGKLFKGYKSNTLYAITNRTSAIYIL